MLRLNRSFLWLSLTACLAASSALAEPPQGAPGESPAAPPRSAAAGSEPGNRPQAQSQGADKGSRPAPPGSAARDKARPLAPVGSGTPGNDRMRERVEQMRERAKTARDRRARANELREELTLKFRDERVNPADLREKFKEFRELRIERRGEQRGRLRRRYGEALREPELKGELELHGRRVAELRRLQFLVATERTGPQRKKLMGRAEQLMDREIQRHEAVMKRWEPAAKDPEPAAPAAVAPAPTGGAKP